MTGLPGRFSARLESIRNDHVRGAGALARRATEALLLLTETAPEELSAILPQAAVALVRAQPAMAPMRQLANRVLSASTVRQLAQICQDFLGELNAAASRISSIASELIPDGGSVATVSLSETVYDTLLAAKRSGKRFEALAAESRPLHEGVTLAGRLAAADIPVSVLADAALGIAARRATLAIAGADAVTPAGVVNKAGTRLLALAAASEGKPFYALCALSKFWPHPLPEEPPKPPRELLEPAPAGVSVLNLYFDSTPLELVSGLVTESGTLAGEELVKRLRGIVVHPALAGLVDL